MKYRCFFGVVVCLFFYHFSLNALPLNLNFVSPNQDTPLVKSYHIGVVQVFMASNRGEVTFLDKQDFYSIGFPMGISFKTPGKAIFDLEFVPVIKPFVNTNLPYSVHMVFHPGILIPLDDGWTFGFRLAFETGVNQFGFTPLINKGFKIGKNTVFFLELVTPGRFGPNKNSGYTQLAGLHAGFGF